MIIVYFDLREVWNHICYIRIRPLIQYKLTCQQRHYMLRWDSSLVSKFILLLQKLVYMQFTLPKFSAQPHLAADSATPWWNDSVPCAFHMIFITNWLQNNWLKHQQTVSFAIWNKIKTVRTHWTATKMTYHSVEVWKEFGELPSRMKWNISRLHAQNTNNQIGFILICRKA